ncbi:MAG: ABC transporter ATP-binding protein [Acidobacteriota bacterium]
MAATDTAESYLDVRDLRKEYGDLVALHGISFAIRPGEIFGLLGPNGAGKSTAINCVCGLVQPTGGSIMVMGHRLATEPVAARRSLGIVPQDLALYEELTGRQNVAYWAAAYGLRGRERRQQVDETLAAVALLDRADDKVDTYSGGMKRRLNVACGLVHRPRVLLLDEPTVAVDPQSRRKLLDLVTDLAANGTAVLYTTHYMEEAQELCDRIAIIDHGEMIAHGSLDELRGSTDERDVLTLRGSFSIDDMTGLIGRIDQAELLRVDDDTLVLTLSKASSHLAQILADISAAGSSVDEVTLTRPTLETLFLRLTGRRLRA